MDELDLDKLVRVEHADGVNYYDAEGNLRAETDDSHGPELYREFDEDGTVTFASMGEIDPSVHSETQITHAKELIHKYLDNEGVSGAGPLGDFEVYAAAWHLDVEADEISDKYVGEFWSAGAFAEDYAESRGIVDDTTEWPYDCINWDMAAEDLMLDHSEWDGHYFRD